MDTRARELPDIELQENLSGHSRIGRYLAVLDGLLGCVESLILVCLSHFVFLVDVAMSVTCHLQAAKLLGKNYRGKKEFALSKRCQGERRDGETSGEIWGGELYGADQVVFTLILLTQTLQCKVTPKRGVSMVINPLKLAAMLALSVIYREPVHQVTAHLQHAGAVFRLASKFRSKRISEIHTNTLYLSASAISF